MPAARCSTELAIVASAGCNLRCSYCRLESRRAVPPWRTVRPGLDTVLLGARRGPALVAFSGGEPLLAFPLVRLSVAYLESHRAATDTISYRLATNGLLLRAEHLPFLERHRFDVQISLDGDRAVQDARAPGTFDRLVRLLGRLARRHPDFLEEQVSVALTVTPRTLPHLADSVRFILDEGVRRVHIGAAMGFGSVSPDVGELGRQFERLARTMRACHERTGEVPVTDLRRPFDGSVSRATSGSVCDAPTGRKLAIDADGSRAPCLMATRTYARGAPAVMRAHLDTLRALAEAGGTATPPLFRRRSRRYSSYGRCADCRWSAACTVCPLAAVMEPRWDDPFRVPDFLCAFSRALLEQRDRLPAPPPTGMASLAPFVRPCGRGAARVTPPRPIA